MKRWYFWLIAIALIIFGAILFFKYVNGDALNQVEWSNSKIGNNVEFGQLSPLTWHAKGVSTADTLCRHLSKDSTAVYTRTFKDTRNEYYGLILTSKYVPNSTGGNGDTEHVTYTLYGCPYDSSSIGYCTLISLVRTATHTDSFSWKNDTTLIQNKTRYNYYKYKLFSTRAAVSLNVFASTYITIITQPQSFWVLHDYTNTDTSQIIYNPMGFTSWTVWMQGQRKDSIKVHIRALASWDGVYWTKVDSGVQAATPTGSFTDSLLHYRTLTIPRVPYIKFEIQGDSANGGWDFDNAVLDSTGLYGTRVHLWYVQGR